MEAGATRLGLRPPTRPAWHGTPDVLRLVWTHPRATVRWILDHGGMRLSILLVLGASASAVVADSALFERTTEFGRWTWLVELSVGMMLGITAWALAAVALTWLGRILGGVGTWRELLVAIAWGQAPAAAGLPFALLKMWSHSLDTADSEFLSDLCLFALWIWALITTMLTVAEAHRFALRRAVLCVLAAAGLYVALGAALHGLFGLDLEL
jgi:hypothetical protein